MAFYEDKMMFFPDDFKEIVVVIESVLEPLHDRAYVAWMRPVMTEVLSRM